MPLVLSAAIAKTCNHRSTKPLSPTSKCRPRLPAMWAEFQCVLVSPRTSHIAGPPIDSEFIKLTQSPQRLRRQTISLLTLELSSTPFSITAAFSLFYCFSHSVICASFFVVAFFSLIVPFSPAVSKCFNSVCW